MNVQMVRQESAAANGAILSALQLAAKLTTSASMTLASSLDLIGNTPLVRLAGPSGAAGCEIYGKCEFANPGASVKDRAALYIVRDAEQQGSLRPGGTIVEGTAGNTGIGLALVGNALGYKTMIVMPETQSQEKKRYVTCAGCRTGSGASGSVREPRPFRSHLPPFGGGNRKCHLGEPVRQHC